MMMKGSYSLLCVFFLTLFAGCASIQSTAVSDIAKGPGRRLYAHDSGQGILMATMPNLDAVVRLKAQCAGNLTGIQTITWMRNWFLIIQDYHQDVSGWCQTFEHVSAP